MARSSMVEPRRSYGRMDLEIAMPLSDQRREPSDSMNALPKARLRREGIEPCTHGVWRSTAFSRDK